MKTGELEIATRFHSKVVKNRKVYIIVSRVGQII